VERIRTARLELATERRGTGAPVLFLSGTGGDLRKTPSVLDGPLAEAFEVLTYDQRGLGRSAHPPGAWTMAGYADDAAALLDAVGWDACAVVGVSFGGMVAQELALRHPQRVRALVLCCTSPGGAGGASWPLHELAALPEGERERLQLELSDRRMDAVWQQANPERVERLLAQQRVQAAIGAGEPGRAEGAARQLEARRHHDVWDRLPSLRIPTLVCAGRHDGIAPPENAEALAARIPGAELRWFDGGHLFLLQDRSAWPAIVAWLR
jgi:3-oxoadipate enol-lactonase